MAYLEESEKNLPKNPKPRRKKKVVARTRKELHYLDQGHI